MKKCLECHTENADGAPTCLACGGGSWPAVTVKAAPVAKPPAKTLTPPAAVLETESPDAESIDPRIVPRRTRGSVK